MLEAAAPEQARGQPAVKKVVPTGGRFDRSSAGQVGPDADHAYELCSLHRAKGRAVAALHLARRGQEPPESLQRRIESDVNDLLSEPSRALVGAW
eukprot:13954300-Alexandrium_andersonii.AAC.1